LLFMAATIGWCFKRDWPAVSVRLLKNKCH